MARTTLFRVCGLNKPLFRFQDELIAETNKKVAKKEKNSRKQKRMQKRHSKYKTNTLRVKNLEELKNE